MMFLEQITNESKTTNKIILDRDAKHLFFINLDSFDENYDDF